VNHELNVSFSFVSTSWMMKTPACEMHTGTMHACMHSVREMFYRVLLSLRSKFVACSRCFLRASWWDLRHWILYRSKPHKKVGKEIDRSKWKQSWRAKSRWNIYKPFRFSCLSTWQILKKSFWDIPLGQYHLRDRISETIPFMSWAGIHPTFHGRHLHCNRNEYRSAPLRIWVPCNETYFSLLSSKFTSFTCKL